MALVIHPAPPCLIVDTVEPLSDVALDACWAYGARAFGRYLENLTAVELARITGRGGGVLLVGESRAVGWVPSATTGAADAVKHLSAARAIGIPAGASIVDDCETPLATAPTPDRIAHVDTWGLPIATAGFLPSVYVGADFGLTSAEWQARPTVHRYARSCSMLRDVAGNPIEPARGWSWVQGLPPNVRIGPVQVDVGLLAQDYMGGRMMLVYDADHAPS